MYIVTTKGLPIDYLAECISVVGIKRKRISKRTEYNFPINIITDVSDDELALIKLAINEKIVTYFPTPKVGDLYAVDTHEWQIPARYQRIEIYRVVTISKNFKFGILHWEGHSREFRCKFRPDNVFIHPEWGRAHAYNPDRQTVT